MRVAAKFVLDSYKAQRVGKSTLTHEHQEKLRDQVRDTRKVLKADENKVSFGDVLKAVMMPRKSANQH